MPLETFMVTVYSLVRKALNTVVPGGNPRKRECPPKLSDAEALTMALGLAAKRLAVRQHEATFAQLARSCSLEVVQLLDDNLHIL